MDANQKNNKKLSKVISTKLSIEDYNAFLILTKLEYQAGLIEEIPSELRYWGKYYNTKICKFHGFGGIHADIGAKSRFLL